MKRTQAGRIVYKRAKHKIKLADVIRMLGRVNFDEENLFDISASVGEFGRAYLRLVQRALSVSGDRLPMLSGIAVLAIGLLQEVERQSKGVWDDFWRWVKNQLRAVFGLAE